jgi:NAD(P)-dependent dehydrogenase (short-subunit alcohol dehydrogenase family)
MPSIDHLLSQQDRVAVVTGAAGGIGHAVAVRLLAAGAHVHLLDRDPDALAEVVAQLGERHPGRVAGASVDVSSAASVADAFSRLPARIDVLVNAAGIREIEPAETLDPHVWERVVAVNLNGPFFCVQQAIPRMRAAGGGAIVNVASVAAVVGMANRPAYTASKHGLVGLTKNLAHDLGPDRIRVNAIAPGTVRTPMTEAYYSDPEFLRQVEGVVPLGFANGTAGDVADTVLYLCSDLSRFVSGVVLPVDGGWLAEKNYAPAGGGSAYAAAPSPVP